jgi:hypothetical protein
MPDDVENLHPGSYAEVVATLTRLGSVGWEVATCVAAGNWLFWTLKRQVESHGEQREAEPS